MGWRLCDAHDAIVSRHPIVQVGCWPVGQRYIGLNRPPRSPVRAAPHINAANRRGLAPARTVA